MRSGTITDANRLLAFMSVEMRELQFLHVLRAVDRVHDLKRAIFVLVREQSREPFNVLIRFVGESQSIQFAQKTCFDDRERVD